MYKPTTKFLLTDEIQACKMMFDDAKFIQTASHKAIQSLIQ